MEGSNVVDCGVGSCVCGHRPTLGVLKDVQKAYEDRMDMITRSGGANKLQMQVEVLQSWVSDLVSQNTLLSRTVEDLETEVTSRLLLERRKHSEKEKNKKIGGKVNEMKMLTESLKLENASKDREIRRLNKDVQQYEQTIMTLRKDLSSSTYHTPDVSKKDAEVMADICCSGTKECRDSEPVKEYGALVRNGSEVYREPQYQMNMSIKPSNENVRSLRQVNVALREEVQAMQRVCAALDEQCHVAALRTQFKDEIIHEMRQQLRKAKAKLKEVNESNSVKLQKERDNENERKASGSFESLTISCVQQQPRRKRRVRPEIDMTSILGLVTSTPNLSQERMLLDESEVSIVEQPPSPPLLLTDSSINETNHECKSRSISHHRTNRETQNINKLLDKGIENKTEKDNRRKLMSKVKESDNASSKSILILIEAEECDCDEIKVQNLTSTRRNTEASIENISDKEKKCLEKIGSKSNTEALSADGISNLNRSGPRAAKFRPVSLAQLMARQPLDNNESGFEKKEMRKNFTVEKKLKEIKRFNDTYTSTSPRLNSIQSSEFVAPPKGRAPERPFCGTRSPLQDLSTPQESLGALSAADSSASEAARAHSLENKLHSTMQILKNKEETVRVQAESLALAEARIAALTAKAQQTHKLHQAQQTPLYSTRSASAGRHVEVTDVSSAADLQDVDDKIVMTLRDNLSVIEELYRECFYESAKQEELITMLRRSYLDMRLVERQKVEQIGRLQHVVHSQRCSLARCQDIATEVESLKMEITNFLNSSQSTDSGVWEREECAGDAADDLRGIADQLRRLRDMLNTDCTCGLEEENMKLKRINDTMEIKIGELRQRINDLEEDLENKENIDQRYQAQIQDKEHELQQVRVQLLALEEGSREQRGACDALNCKLKQMEVLLRDKSSELSTVQQQCEAQEVTIKELREEINRVDLVAQERGQVRGEVASLSARVARWRGQLAGSRRRLRALGAELQRAREQCRHLAAHCREKTQVAAELQSQLEEAQSRGAELCGDARRAVCGVRHWLRKQRKKNTELEEKIKQQEIIIQTLQQQGATQCADRTITREVEPCCSRYLPRVGSKRSERSLASARKTGCSKCASNRVDAKTSGSEIASSSAPPTPPRRLLRKKPFCEDTHCQWPATHECSAQRPSSSDVSVNARLSHDLLTSYTATPTRAMLQPDELLERVERAHEALADAHRRWARGRARGPGGAADSF
ncbi:GRIP and coiled-coil domain-containing protein 2-like [Pararge aegeria]|uniref:GRIP and coiled-coil domain-containing protein 2-like n=1 Tax=Pararge aegeria TaxID=116150 RepID=UPI0019D1AD84|nr:GRIP and coiled-coil domain-containing protein 2-like [Pararge aegeria]